jgi:LytS/YehU family sensor histidine kinase
LKFVEFGFTFTPKAFEMDKRFIGWHIIFWTLIIGITLGVASVLLPIGNAILFTVVSCVFYAIVFYVNTLVLFPKFYVTTQSTKYFIFVFFLLLLATFFLVLIEQILIEPASISIRHSANPKVMMTARGFLWLLLMIVVGTVYLIQKRLKEQSLSHKEIQEIKLKTELKLLRSQINPHFLFNALNNIYALCYMKSDRAPMSILKLSNMLRYVIDDCASENVPIKSEIEYIKNYIDFQKMKSAEEMNVHFNYGELNPTIQIAPMLFIPFVENSFKYSMIEEFQNAKIEIELLSEADGKLKFLITNTIPPVSKVKPGVGTGISNVKQRLKIIYPEKHQLIISESENNYQVTLTIDTNDIKMHSN